MGGIARPARRAVIYWRLEDVGVGGFAGLARPVALVLPEAEIAALPSLTAAQLADAAHGGAPSVLRRQLLAALAQRVLGVGARDVRLLCGAGGQRMLREPAVCASVAWRPGWVAAAIAPAPVGIDVELVAEAEAVRDVALAGFDGSAAELASWHGPAGVWAAKEAVLKAHGRDLTSPPTRWDFNGMTLAAMPFASLAMTIGRRGPIVIALATEM
ncbi:MAG: 4'-phosphopantetheinyl transferase superfamily protein [Janthinobacterium lividum]